ncbi:MAG: urease accessory protein UreD [Burkholderiaceae bacterium]
MSWTGSLRLAYHSDVVRGAPRTVLRDCHDGPLRVLASLYPEAPRVCHNVLVHPPGGLVGGDDLGIQITLAADAHALVTTAGATRYYRSRGEAATQHVSARVAAGARLEWLPLETIAYSGCIGTNRMRFDLEPGAETIGWDVLALGLPASQQDFERGSFRQSVELPGRWLERGLIDAGDTRLLDSPLGWAGQRVLATMWFASGAPLSTPRRQALLDAARAATDADALRRSAGATAVHDDVVVLRVLAPRVEPAMTLLVRVWTAWREAAWQLPACVPRVWRT